MNYCSQCGSTVALKIPQGDNLERYVCDNCGMIHYQNPNNVAGAILVWQDRVLMCKRAIEPRYGLWTFPAGFMENNETLHQAAVRESIEEANAQVGPLSLFGVFSMPYISQVHMIFSGRLLSDSVSPGAESLEVELLTRDQIPWDELAFPVIKQSLELYFQHGPDSGKVFQAWFSRTPDREITVHFED